MSTPWVIAVTLMLLQSVSAPPESPASTLSGIVLDADTAAPIAGATVYALGPGSQRLTRATSGLGGRWRLAGLPEGVYRIIALAPGFAPVWVVEREESRPTPDDRGGGDHAISLGPAEDRGDLIARLMPAGSISGRVTSGSGVPVPDVVVTIDGAPAMGTPRVGQAVTGRDGRYRLEGVAPGERLVVVAPNRFPSNRALHRGWVRGEARPVTVRAREHAGGVDIVVSLSSHVVTGQVAAPGSAADVLVRLLSNGGLTLRTLSFQPEHGTIGPDIVDGGHHVMWVSGRDGATALAGWQALEISGDGELPTVLLVTTGTVRGRIRSASGGPLAVEGLAVGSLLWVDGDGVEILGEREALVSSDGSFELSGILGPRRLYVSGLPAGWTMTGIRVGGMDVPTPEIDVGPAQTIDGVEILVDTGAPRAFGAPRAIGAPRL